VYSFPFVRPLATLLAIVSFTGCSSWRPAPGSPDPAQLPAGTDEIRVTLSDGSRLELHSPVLRADSLYGLEPKSGSGGHAPATRKPLALATANIASLERPEDDSGKTTAFVLGFGLLAGAIVYLFANPSATDGFGGFGGAHRTLPVPR